MILGRFKGTDGSCRFKKGQWYWLDIKVGREYIWLEGKSILGGRDIYMCPYSSFEALLQNWDVEHIKDKKIMVKPQKPRERGKAKLLIPMHKKDADGCTIHEFKAETGFFRHLRKK